MFRLKNEIQSKFGQYETRRNDFLVNESIRTIRSTRISTNWSQTEIFPQEKKLEANLKLNLMTGADQIFFVPPLASSF